MLALPIKLLIRVFENVSLGDIFNCEQTCSKMQKNVSIIFNNTKKPTIFEKKDHPTFSFSITCSLADLKAQLISNAFFKHPFFESFIIKFSTKLAERFFVLVEEEEQNESQEIPEKMVNLFDDKLFALLEPNRYGSLIIKPFVEKYLTTPLDETEYLEGFDRDNNSYRKYLHCLAYYASSAVAKEHPFLEQMYHALFDAFMKKQISLMKESPRDEQIKCMTYIEGHLNYALGPFEYEDNQWYALQDLENKLTVDGTLENKEHLTLQNKIKGYSQVFGKMIEGSETEIILDKCS